MSADLTPLGGHSIVPASPATPFKTGSDSFLMFRTIGMAMRPSRRS